MSDPIRVVVRRRRVWTSLLVAAALGVSLSPSVVSAATVTVGDGTALVDSFSNARCFRIPPNSDEDHQETTGLNFTADITSDAVGSNDPDDCGPAATNLPRATARATQTTTITPSSGGLTVVSSGSASGRTQICASNQNHNARSELSRTFTVTGGPVDYTLSGTGSGMLGDHSARPSHR